MPLPAARWLLIALLSFALARIADAAPGDPDPSFGSGGQVTTDFSAERQKVTGVVVQPDGKVVAVGEADFSSRAGVARYLADGTPDPTFGTGGRFVTDELRYPLPPVLRPDGTLTIAGYAWERLIRLDPAGALDGTFGLGGIVDVRRARFNALALRPDGFLLAAGSYGAGPGPRDFSVGFIDPSGLARGEASPAFSDRQVNHAARTVAARADGGFVAAGNSGELIALARYYSDGQLNRNFGHGGIVTGDMLDPGHAQGFVSALALAPKGEVIAVGSGVAHTGYRGFVARFHEYGLPDSTFTASGIVDLTPADLPFPVGQFLPSSVVLQPDGRILIGGPTFPGSAIARFTTDGKLDPTFGVEGMVSFPDAPLAAAVTLALAPDAKLVVAGTAPGFVVRRLLNDVCGNGTIESPEQCDDGNFVNGDGCDSNCQPTACGNGVVGPGEECDGGNVGGGDCCDASCHLVFARTPCDDHDLCTTGETCSSGACGGGRATVCDDGLSCTVDRCDPASGQCLFEQASLDSCPDPTRPPLQLRPSYDVQSQYQLDDEAHFGRQVLLDGDRFFVLQQNSWSSSVQVFDLATGALLHLVKSAHEEDSIGFRAMALAGDELLVAETGVFSDVPFGGAILRFDRRTLAARGRIEDPTPATRGFGTPFLVLDDFIVAFDQGEKTLHVFDRASGELLRSLREPGSPAHSPFGSTVLKFSRAMIATAGTGVVYIFEVDTGLLRRTFGDPTPGGAFGGTMAMVGDRLLVGGHAEDRVYVYDAVDRNHIGTIVDPDHLDRTFGNLLGGDDRDFFIGRLGRLYVYDRATFALTRTILDPYPTHHGCFPTAVHVVGPGHDLLVDDTCSDVADDETGVVHLFERATGTLRASVAPWGDSRDATHVAALDGDRLIIGVGDDNEGRLFVYRDLPLVGCAQEPLPDCAAATQSYLAVEDHGADKYDRLQWRWRGGGAAADFGDPATHDYAFCLYGESGGKTVLMHTLPIPAFATCGNRTSTHACWRAPTADSPAWRYSDGPAFDVIRLGTGKRREIALRAHGAKLALPVLAGAPPLRAQLQRDGKCWEATYDGRDIRWNVAARIRARR